MERPGRYTNRPDPEIDSAAAAYAQWIRQEVRKLRGGVNADLAQPIFKPGVAGDFQQDLLDLSDSAAHYALAAALIALAGSDFDA